VKEQRLAETITAKSVGITSRCARVTTHKSEYPTPGGVDCPS